MISRSEINYRVGSTGLKGGKTPYAMFLVYIDARTASRELDEKYEGKWSFKWSQVEGMTWAIKGKLVIKKEHGQFTYEDAGYPNDFKKSQDPNDSQWLKDAISDALKRCAVQAGVGRFLYDAPFLYTEEIFTRNKNGKEVFSKLNPMGKKMIKGDIDKWFKTVKQ